jgi:two-component system chemotaxis sensor kinase CheA
MGFSELSEEFAREAVELLERVERSLLDLEADAGGVRSPELTRALQRTLHTLKGNSGLVGAPILQSALHLMEDAAGSLAESPERASWLLRAMDLVRDEVRAIGTGRTAADAGEELRALVAGGDLEPLPAADGFEARELEIRVPRERLDQLLAAAGELMVTNTQLQRLGVRAREEVAPLHHWLDRLDRTSRLVHELVLKARTLPVKHVFGRFVRLVRDEALSAGKEARLEVRGEQVEIDRLVLEALSGPLVHLVRNAVAHGIESPAARIAADKAPCGVVTLEAATVGERVHLTIADDGAGLDVEAIAARALELGLDSGLAPEQLIFVPGFSTVPSVTQSAGRGVGLDVVGRAVSELGGTLEVRFEPERGTIFQLSVPASLALQRAVLFDIGDETFALPSGSVLEAVRYAPEAVRWMGAGRACEVGGRLVPLLETERHLGAGAGEGGYLLLLEGGGTLAMHVDRLHGQQDFVFQSLGLEVRGRGPVSGAALLEDGRVVLRLSPERLARAAGLRVSPALLPSPEVSA